MYIGLSLVGFVIFITLAIPPPDPLNLYIDDGCLRIIKGYFTPEEGLEKLGYPLNANDTISVNSDTGTGEKFIVVHRAKEIYITDIDHTSTITSVGKTVRDLLNEYQAEFRFSKLDRITPPPDTPLENGMKINITRVSTRDEIREEPVEPGYRMIPDENLPRGKIVTVSKGTPGLKHVTYRNFFKNGVKTLTKKIGEKIVESGSPGIRHVGARVLVMSRSGYRGKRMLEMEATAYDAGPKSTGKWCDGKTATGRKAEYGVVAVDPRVIPLGTKLFVEGYGYAIAADVGGAIKGLKIDLFYESRKEALKFGRRKVKVYVLDE